MQLSKSKANVLRNGETKVDSKLKFFAASGLLQDVLQTFKEKKTPHCFK